MDIWSHLTWMNEFKFMCYKEVYRGFTGIEVFGFMYVDNVKLDRG